MALDLEPVRRIVAQDHGLASIAVVRADGTPHTSLVNAGVLDHPRTAEPVVGYVTYGKVKLRNLRDRPATSILWRAGWQWAGVEGPSELIGPGDTVLDADREWAAALAETCRTAGVALRATVLSTPGGVRWLG